MPAPRVEALGLRGGHVLAQPAAIRNLQPVR